MCFEGEGEWEGEWGGDSGEGYGGQGKEGCGKGEVRECGVEKEVMGGKYCLRIKQNAKSILGEQQSLDDWRRTDEMPC